MSKFYTYTESMVRGPFSREKLIQMCAAEQIDETTPISQGKGTPWLKLADYPDIIAEANKPAQDNARDEVKEKQIFYCPHCNQKYSGDRSWLGREVICHSCSKLFMAGGEAAAAQNSSSHSSEENSFFNDLISGDTICPHCWQKFDLSNICYIASHPALTGDNILGAGAMKRFAPTSFNALGQALDEMGAACSDTACPHCHLKVPLSIVEEDALYISLVGAPSSGKSYYLAALLNQLRKVMPDKFAYTFSDIDPEMNMVLNSYEEAIFRAPRQNEVAVLPKTQQTGDDFVNVITLSNIPIYLPKPFVYEIHSQTAGPDQIQGCNLVFYDNAGEHFAPGADNMINPGTRHLACSNGIIFIFDPINDAIMRRCCDEKEPQLASDEHIYEQSKLMSEMIARIRRHRNMNTNERCSIPLVIAVGKYDAWQNKFGHQLKDLPLYKDSAAAITSQFNMDTVMSVSYDLRQMMLEYAPSLLHSAEGFFENVIFVPFSSFGSISRVSGSGQLGVIPAEIAPVWVEAPFLTLLSELAIIPRTNLASAQGAVPLSCSKIDKFLVFNHPVSGAKIRLPENYAGAILEINGQRYQLPLPQTAAATNNAGSYTASRVEDLWN